MICAGLGLLAVRLQPLGQAEVGDLGHAVRGEQDVGRLEVAVDDPGLVGDVDGPGQGGQQLGGRPARLGVAAQPIVQAPAVEQLQHTNGGSLDDRLGGNPSRAGPSCCAAGPRRPRRPRGGDRPPRPQAVERPLHRGRHPQDHRLRPGQAAGVGQPPDRDRPDHGLAQLHGPRAGPRAHAGTSARPPTSTPWARSSTRC